MLWFDKITNIQNIHFRKTPDICSYDSPRQFPNWNRMKQQEEREVMFSQALQVTEYLLMLTQSLKYTCTVIVSLQICNRFVYFQCNKFVEFLWINIYFFVVCLVVFDSLAWIIQKRWIIETYTERKLFTRTWGMKTDKRWIKKKLYTGKLNNGTKSELRDKLFYSTGDKCVE